MKNTRRAKIFVSLVKLFIKYQKNMILPEFILSSRQNQTWTESGIDSFVNCRDQKHFVTFPHNVIYQYNSRGFRDAEWPSTLAELQDCVWCVGDSFTVGIGSPAEHMWTNILESKINKRCINVSMDGASNKWIARKVIEILKIIQPKLLITHWSYINRDESPDDTLIDEDRRIKDITDKASINQLIENNCKIILEVETHKKQCSIIHSFIPSYSALLFFDSHFLDVWNDIKGTDWPNLPKNYHEFLALNQSIVKKLSDYADLYTTLKTWYSLFDKITYVPKFKKIDIARDGLHYDIFTATNFADQLKSLIADLPVS
jgi:hypothetical protein